MEEHGCARAGMTVNSNGSVSSFWSTPVWACGGGRGGRPHPFVRYGGPLAPGSVLVCVNGVCDSGGSGEPSRFTRPGGGWGGYVPPGTNPDEDPTGTDPATRDGSGCKDPHDLGCAIGKKVGLPRRPECENQGTFQDRYNRNIDMMRGLPTRAGVFLGNRIVSGSYAEAVGGLTWGEVVSGSVRLMRSGHFLQSATFRVIGSAAMDATLTSLGSAAAAAAAFELGVDIGSRVNAAVCF
jgi:hypothetical protein